MTGKVLGFRAWGLDGYKLMSTNLALRAYWTIGVNKAECRARHVSRTFPPTSPHEAPDPQCECGLHALHDLRYWHTPNPIVFGAVLAWGRMEVHSNGFRAEYAEPVMLAYDLQQSYEHVKRVEAIAGEMELPFVCVTELVEEAARFGKTVAPELRPEPREGLMLSGMSGNTFQGNVVITTGRASQVAASSVVFKTPPTLLGAMSTSPLARKPTWKDWAPMIINGSITIGVMAHAIIIGSWLAAAVGVWCALMTLLPVRFYRRRFR